MPNVLTTTAASLAIIDSPRDRRNGVADPERPYWLTGPCPVWCVEEHLAECHPDDRHHAGVAAAVALTLYPAVEWQADGGWEADRIAVMARQHVDQAAGVVDLYRGDQPEMLTLTAAEARELSRNLAVAANQLDGCRA